jgi:radical SAM protein with 4Fe4S-binding SPASM domain
MISINSCLTKLSTHYKILGCFNINSPDDLDLVALEIKLKDLWKKKFEDNERIVFAITGDYYHNDNLAGLGLQSIQTLLNTIDISNFFVEIVTSNSAIEQEYQWILQNVSTDPVPVHINVCIGDYHQWNGAKFNVLTKYNQLSTQTDIYKNFDKTQQNLLINSKVFCIFPWTHLMIEPTGNVKPCCSSQQIVGNVNKDSLKTIWNSPDIKKLRKNMLNDIPSPECDVCYNKEKIKKESMRMSFNRQLAHRIYKVNKTQPTGELNDFSLNYIDSRFNNLCNLSCRSCNALWSSSWHKVAVKLELIDKQTKPLLIAGKNPNGVYNQIMEHIDSVDMIYFAGGEPLIIAQFYEILDYLERNKQFDKKLIYNTNFTQTVYKKRSIFEIWKKFHHVSVGASLDAEGARAEYLRCGTHWNNVIENRKRMLEICPNVDFYVSVTPGLINALHIPDFHKSWVEQDLIQAQDFAVQILYSPAYQSIGHAPDFLKQQIREKYVKHLEWLRPRDKLGRATNGYESLIEYIDQSTDQFDPQIFWTNIDRLDQYHHTDLIEVFPELAQILRG